MTNKTAPQPRCGFLIIIILFRSEERNRHSTGAYMGANHAAHNGYGQLFHIAFPKIRAVLDILLQQRITEAGIAQHHRHGKIHAASFLNFLHQQIIALTLCSE